MFKYLRVEEWHPTFTWVSSSAEAADLINQPHEDYPRMVQATELELERLAAQGVLTCTLSLLRQIHLNVFGDRDFAGRWRTVRVRVGLHIPPPPEEVSELMDQLEAAYESFVSTSVLKAWYWDFESIHPFEDGNGRVGGIIVAADSHILSPERGWLALNHWEGRMSSPPGRRRRPVPATPSATSSGLRGLRSQFVAVLDVNQ